MWGIKLEKNLTPVLDGVYFKMRNPDYHPDKAHLPSKEDMVRWKNGGRARHEREKLRVVATIEAFKKHRADVWK